MSALVLLDEATALENEMLALSRLRHKLEHCALPDGFCAAPALGGVRQPYEFLGHIATAKSGFAAWFATWAGPRKRSPRQTWALLLAVAQCIAATPALIEACAATHRPVDRGVAFARVLAELDKDALVRASPHADQ